MSDNKLRFATYKYCEFNGYDHVTVTVQISIYKREMGLKNLLSAPRAPFYIKIEDVTRYEERGLIIDGKNIEELDVRFEKISFYYFTLAYLDSHSETLALPFLDYIDIGNYARFGFFQFSQRNSSYSFLMYCDRYLYPKLSQLVGYSIETSEDYNIAFKVTEKSVTLNKVKQGIYGVQKMPEMKELFTYQNHMEFKKLIFPFLKRELFNSTYHVGGY